MELNIDKKKNMIQLKLNTNNFSFIEYIILVKLIFIYMKKVKQWRHLLKEI